MFRVAQWSPAIWGYGGHAYDILLEASQTAGDPLWERAMTELHQFLSLTAEKPRLQFFSRLGSGNGNNTISRIWLSSLILQSPDISVDFSISFKVNSFCLGI